MKDKKISNLPVVTTTTSSDLFVTVNDGITKQTTLEQILSGATDTFVTGGTYNTSASTITFTNNQGGEFDVSGFTSGNSDLTYKKYTIDYTNLSGETGTTANIVLTPSLTGNTLVEGFYEITDTFSTTGGTPLVTFSVKNNLNSAIINSSDNEIFEFTMINSNGENIFLEISIFTKGFGSTKTLNDLIGGSIDVYLNLSPFNIT